METALHIYDATRGNRLCTFYDRRQLGDYLFRMFPACVVADMVIQVQYTVDDVRTLCRLNDALLKGREWLMCREPMER